LVSLFSKTKENLPTTGFDGIILTIYGSRDYSNPIAINGQLTGKLQFLTVNLEDIGRIEKAEFKIVCRGNLFLAKKSEILGKR